MSMPVFKRVLAMATAMAAAAVVFATPSASAAPSTPWGFTLVTHGDVSADVVDGLYYWQNAASSQCLNQDYSGGTAHHDVLAWACDTAADNQWWWLSSDSDNSAQWILENYKSGQCLNQDYSGGTAHHDVLAWPCDSSADNEKWYLYANTARTVFYLQNVKSGQYLNQDYSGGTAHHDVLAWPWAGGTANERWYREP